MTKKYTNEKLIFELKRFYDENNRIPKMEDTTRNSGYPSYKTYQNRFGSFKTALKIAGLYKEKMKKQIENETCCRCGCNKKQTLGWVEKGLLEHQVMCLKCYQKSKSYNIPDYKKGKLDKNSDVGKGFVGQRVVAKYLGLELKDDCNCSVNFGHPYDLYDKDKYGKIDVKTSKLNTVINGNPFWYFILLKKIISDTYIMLAFDENRKNILKGWCIDSKNDLVNKKSSIGITNIQYSLRKWKNYEINNCKLNEILHKMSQKRKDTNGENCVFNNNDLTNN